MTYLPHRRQFLLGSDLPDLGRDLGQDLGEGWVRHVLPDGLTLLRHQDLSFREDPDGSLVLGDWLPTVAGEPTVETAAGRHVRIVWPFLEPDPCALRSVYVLPGNSTPLISSSPGLLAHVCGLTRADRELRRRINWVPGPDTPLSGVYKLLPDQRIHLPSGRVETAVVPLTPAGSVAEATGILSTALGHAVVAAAGEGTRVLLALTAGLDSRTLLATLLSRGVVFEVVTQVVKSPADVRVAAQICQYLGIRHHVVGPVQGPPDVLEAWRAHTLTATRDVDDQRLLPQHQYRFLTKGTVLIRGGCFEIGRRCYARTLEGLSWETATGQALWARFETGCPDPATVAGLDRWLDFRRAYPGGLDLVDAFYRDQRAAGWLASIELGLDALPGRSVQPANARAIMGALLTPPPTDRRAGILQHRLIQSLEPCLLRFPINPRGLDRYTTSANVRFRRALRLLASRWTWAV